jgi:hypothetical protein
MEQCRICGDEARHPYTCKYCGGIHCSSHRLPENHHCSGVSKAKTLGPEFRDSSGQKVRKKRSRQSSRPKAAEVEHTTGNTPSDDELGESGPDVAIDGSLLKEDSTESVSQSSGIGAKVGTALAVLLYPIYVIPSVLGWIWDQIFQKWVLALALVCSLLYQFYL